MEVVLTIICVLLIIGNIVLFVSMCRNSKTLIKLIREWKEKVRNENKQ